MNQMLTLTGFKATTIKVFQQVIVKFFQKKLKLDNRSSKRYCKNGNYGTKTVTTKIKNPLDGSNSRIKMTELVNLRKDQ